MIERLGQIAGPETIFAAGVGQHQMWAAQFIQYENPYTWLNSGGAGTMGYAVPAAMGAKVGKPDTLVWAIDGDGCFQMTNQELATCAIEGIPIKVAVINNGNLGMVRQWQTLFYGERYSQTELGTHKHRIPDFVKLADALGCVGLRCETKSDVDATIEKAMSINDAPVVVDFTVGQDAMVWPMVAAGSSNDEIQAARDIRPNLRRDRLMADQFAARPIGLLGGMSWQSTRGLLPANSTSWCSERRGGHSSAPLLLWSVDFAEIEALQRAGDWAAQGRLLAEAARGCKRPARRDRVGAPTRCTWSPTRSRRQSRVPFIDLIDVTAQAVAERGFDHRRPARHRLHDDAATSTRIGSRRRRWRRSCPTRPGGPRFSGSSMTSWCTAWLTDASRASLHRASSRICAPAAPKRSSSAAPNSTLSCRPDSPTAVRCRCSTPPPCIATRWPT